jgi:hypothetical protein
MTDILIAFTRIIIGMVLIAILVGVMIGVPTLIAAAVECVYCVIFSAPFSWTVPLIIGVGSFIFMCLVIADAKGGN